MKNKNKYLASEASFQDSKIEYNVRKELDKYYSDSAYKYKNQYIFDVIGNVEGKRILDLGCGAGYTSLKLLKKGAHVTAIDISPKSIEHLAGEVKALGMSDRITALVMDAHNLQFDDGYFDLVVGDGILHHLPDLEKALAEIKRVLKPTG